MKTPTKPFALCIDNTDYRASLIPGKVYRILACLSYAADRERQQLVVAG